MQTQNVQMVQITTGQDRIYQVMSSEIPMTKNEIRAKLKANMIPSSNQMKALIEAGLVKVCGSKAIETWNGKASNAFVHAKTYLKVRKPYQVIRKNHGTTTVLVERTGNE